MDTKSIFMGFTVPPSIEDLQSLAEDIVDGLPDEMSKHTGKLQIAIEEFPDDFIQEQLELETPFDIYGVYQSASPAAKSRIGVKTLRQDTLFLYRRAILDAWCDTGDDLTRLVNQIILREIGNHFGFSEDELDMYEEEQLAARGETLGTG